MRVDRGGRPFRGVHGKRRQILGATHGVHLSIRSASSRVPVPSRSARPPLTFAGLLADMPWPSAATSLAASVPSVSGFSYSVSCWLNGRGLCPGSLNAEAPDVASGSRQVKPRAPWSSFFPMLTIWRRQLGCGTGRGIGDHQVRLWCAAAVDVPHQPTRRRCRVRSDETSAAVGAVRAGVRSSLGVVPVRLAELSACAGNSCDRGGPAHH